MYFACSVGMQRSFASLRMTMQTYFASLRDSAGYELTIIPAYPTTDS
jgi:hypothetical protein